MYNIGQFRSSSQSNYSTDLLNLAAGTEYIDADYQQVPTLSISFQDAYKQFSGDAIMDNQNSYYLRFSVMQRTDSIQNFSLKLRNSLQQQDNEQSIERYEVTSGKMGETKQIFFEVIFSPNATYNQIVWELTRTGKDYDTTLEENGQARETGVIGRKMKVKIYKFTKLKNIMQTLRSHYSMKYLTKIGIQGPPALLTCINRQQIRLGRNGIYEINNGINITSISFVPNDNDYFIMDFEY